MGMPVAGHHVWGRAYGHDNKLLILKEKIFYDNQLSIDYEIIGTQHINQMIIIKK